MSKIKIKDVCHILNGYAFKSSAYLDNGIRVLRIANVQKGVITDNLPQYYPISTEKELNKYMLYEDDLLMSLTGNVGRVGLVEKFLLPAALNQRVACIRVKDDKILDKKYIFQLFNSNYLNVNVLNLHRELLKKI